MPRAGSDNHEGMAVALATCGIVGRLSTIECGVVATDPDSIRSVKRKAESESSNAGGLTPAVRDNDSPPQKMIKVSRDDELLPSRSLLHICVLPNDLIEHCFSFLLTVSKSRRESLNAVRRWISFDCVVLCYW